MNGGNMNVESFTNEVINLACAELQLIGVVKGIAEFTDRTEAIAAIREGVAGNGKKIPTQQIMENDFLSLSTRQVIEAVSSIQ